MKHILPIIFLVAFLLTGCFTPGMQDNTAPPETETQAQEPGQSAAPKGFGLAYVAEYGFNPYDCVCITNRPVCSLVYESLFVLNNAFQPEPVLCEKFAVSENGKTYLITLCDGVTFSDGTQLTAMDAAASLEAARDSDYYGSRFSKVEGFAARDARTLEITLSKPYENLPLLLDVPIVKAGTERRDRPLGTGPYAFDGDEEEGTLCLRRNRSWWQDNRAPVEYDTILLTAAQDPTAVRDSFEFGSTALVCADLNAPNAVGYRCDYELWDCPTATMMFLGFNLKSGIFSGKILRPAVTHIIDREELVSSVCKGFAQAAYLPCSPASPLYDQDLAARYGYDETAFQDALFQSNFPSDYVGILLVCSGDPTRVELARRVAETLTAAGVAMEVKAVDEELYRSRLQSGKYDMFIGETRLSCNFDLTEFFRAGGSLCYGGLRNQTMEQLCYDALENSGNCYDLYKNVMENGYFCPLLFKSYAVMANRGVIGSLQPAVDFVFHMAGGRSLADAGVSYQELTDPEDPEETEEWNP